MHIIQDGELPGALKNLEQSVALNNNFALSKLIIGLCNSRLNKLGKAEKNFIDVLRIWPRTGCPDCAGHHLL